VDITYHYPPDLLALLVDAIPRLCRGKADVILFFRGAGVEAPMLNDLDRRVRTDRASIGKHEIARTVLKRLNERGEATLRERREVVKRVVEFEDFSACWDNDRLAAQGLVGQVRQLVNVKDSFTRMKDEREAERRASTEARAAKLKAVQEKKRELAAIRDDLASLFAMKDAWARGKKLEGVLNRLFKAYGVSVREAFTLRGDESKGIVEQIDGVIEIGGHLYLVEMKWWDGPLGPGDVAQHLVRVHQRDGARGIFISASGYTPAALQSCRDYLSKAVFVLCELEEFVRALEEDRSIAEILKQKVDVAIIEKKPLHRIS
jgi:hypothetical protein